MGISSDAQLIWGIPIKAYDAETGEPTCWWKADGPEDTEGDWIDVPALYLAKDGISDPSDEVPPEIWHGYDKAAFDAWKAEHPDWQGRRDAHWEAKRDVQARFEIKPYGHYESTDEQGAILTPTGLEPYAADCWTPCKIPMFLDNVGESKAASKASDDILWLGFPPEFAFYAHPDAGWHMVVSVG